MKRTLLAIAFALILAGCVTPQENPPAASTAPAQSITTTPTPTPTTIPTPTPVANPKCVLTNYERLPVGATECELAWGYPDYTPMKDSSCGYLTAPNVPADIAGPAGTGNLVTCTESGLVGSECCDKLKIVWPDGTCSASRMFCIGSHGNQEQRRLTGPGHHARCAACEDLCPGDGKCVDGACYRTEKPGQWTQKVNCGTLEPFK